MSNQNLYLIGTLHHDLDGKERLDTLLNTLSPSIVALEFHKDNEVVQATKIVNEKQRLDEMLNTSGLNLNSRQKDTLLESSHLITRTLGYEINAAKDYVEKHNDCALEYIDISVFTSGKDQFNSGYMQAAEIIFKENMRQSETVKLFLERLDSGIDNYIQCMKDDVKKLYQNSELLSEFYKYMCNPQTLKSMESSMSKEAIQALEQIYNPLRDVHMAQRVRELYDGVSRLVVIVGLGHLEGLKMRLGRLNPHVMTLAEYSV